MNKNSNSTLIWVGVIIAVLVAGGLAVYFAKGSGAGGNSMANALSAVTDTDWSAGNKNAPVTLIEYSDFQCPSCAAYFPLIEELRRNNPDKLRFVYRHFPLAQHKNAEPATLASEAAGKEGKFFEMYVTLFTRQKEWENEPNPTAKFAAYAVLIGLDAKKFLDDYKDAGAKEKIRADYKDGFRAGVNSTPTFFVNGKRIANPNNLNEFQKIIDDAASTAGSEIGTSTPPLN